MNEITRIHLGRQPFTISMDAHKALREYLESIKKVVGGSREEVIEEIELRMAELLLERGITEDKTVLIGDVCYLMEQLGKPGDFKTEDGDDEAPGANDESQSKRLFRDEKNGIVAGVCSGLAAYINVDVTIVRLAFILLTIMAGWGILLYIVLWIVVPPAKTNSDRLQMRGKAINIDNLSEMVNREVTAAVGRVKKVDISPNSAVRSVAQTIIKIIGVGILLGSVLTLFGLAVAAGYMFTHQDGLVQGVVSFPVGVKENILTICAFAAAGIISLWFSVVGAAMIRGKWKVPGWFTVAAVGLLMAAVGTAAVITPDSVNSVYDRYHAAEHSTMRQVEPFDSVKLKGRMLFSYQKSDTYKVKMHYLGGKSSDKIKVSVSAGKMTVDTTDFMRDNRCNGLCLGGASNFPEVTVYAPSIKQLDMNNYQLSNTEIEAGTQYTTADQ
jgi:phage shock protein PspC (stress-responsive transcriptional regulator)